MQRAEPERTLTDAQRDEFEDMLRALTLERSQIKGVMGFSLDNADAAGEVVLSLCSSITAIPVSIVKTYRKLDYPFKPICLLCSCLIGPWLHPVSLCLSLTFGLNR